MGIALLGVAVMLVWMGDPLEKPLGRGEMAPVFTLPGLSDAGRPTSLQEMRGQVVLVNFWATWCKPCEDEMPAMGRLYEELVDEGFSLLAIAVDRDVDAIREFQERLKISFPILHDSDERVSRLYQTTGFPESVLVNRRGEIVERYVGPREWDHRDYLERIRRLLAESK